MKEYQIVWGNSSSELSEKVRIQMKFSWEPLGGIASGKTVTLGKERNILYQALIKLT